MLSEFEPRALAAGNRCNANIMVNQFNFTTPCSLQQQTHTYSVFADECVDDNAAAFIYVGGSRAPTDRPTNRHTD